MLSHITFSDLLLQIKSIDEDILAVFFCDIDGMPIEEMGLFINFNREEAFAFTSFSVQVDDAMLSIAEEFKDTRFNSLLAESDDHKFLILHAEPFVLGVITKPEARIGLIRTITMDLLNKAEIHGL